MDLETLDRNIEADLWWGSYAGRSMAPAFFVCALVTISLAMTIRLVWRDRFLHPQLMWHLTLLANGLVWLPPLLKWAYRTLTISYRLTTHRLYRDVGFDHVADGAVELRDLRDVAIVQGKLDRFLGVGRLDVYHREGSKPFQLKGIHDPEWVASLIRSAARRAREESDQAQEEPAAS